MTSLLGRLGKLPAGYACAAAEDVYWCLQRRESNPGEENQEVFVINKGIVTESRIHNGVCKEQW